MTRANNKKEQFQSFCKDEFDKCVERIRKRMQKDEFRTGTAFNYLMTCFQKNDTMKKVFNDEAYRSDLKWSPYRIIGKLVNDYIDYEYDMLHGDIRFNIIHKDEIIKKIDELNKKQEEEEEANKRKEYKMYLKLKAKYDKGKEKK